MKQINAKVSIGFIFTLLFLMIVIVTTQLALKQIKTQSQKNIKDSLYTVMHTTHEALNIWIKHQKYNINEFIGHKDVAVLTQLLLLAHENKKDIVNSSILKNLRNIVKNRITEHDSNGFFIIAPDKTSIASMRDSNIGITNIIHKQRPQYLDRAFKGETLFIPTIHSEVALKTSTGKLKKQLPTIFMAAPIFNEKREVIAVLTFRLNPSSDFTRITQLGRIGGSGETYAFDEKGLLITESRFDHQLKKIGLIQQEDKGMISIRIADPGGNMLEGFVPTVPIQKRPLTRMVQNALSGKATYNIEGYRDYRGVKVVGTWLWDKQLGFGLATEMDIKEAMSPFHDTKLTIIIVLVMTIILSFGLLFLLLRLEKNSKMKLKKAYGELEHKVQERTKEFKESEEKFRCIFESSADAMILLNTKGLIDCNESTLRMFGCKNTESFISKQIGHWSASTQNHDSNNSTEYKVSIQEKIQLALSKGKYSFEWNYLRANGDIFPAEVLLTRVYIHEKKVIQGTIRDISERKKAQKELATLNKELERLSFLDGLTGIANRRMFDQTLDIEWAHAQRDKEPLSLIMIDIDFFKQYNDQYGHQEGDNCLIQVSTALNAILKRSVDLVARYGGEEFVILLPDTTLEKASLLAQKCRNKIMELNIPHELSTVASRVTISLGVSSITPTSKTNQKELIESADKLLYKAKESGRNRVKF